MNSSPANTQRAAIQRRTRWEVLAAITLMIHVGIVISPIRVFSLRSSDSGLVPYLVLSVAAMWGLSIFLRYRHPAERIVSCCSLAMSVIEVMSVGLVRT
jgi:hypothetical protein